MRFALRPRLGFALALGPLATLLLWYALYPGPVDSKGPRYVLWKLGVLPFDAEVVYGSMMCDLHAEDLVRGRTVAQLERRFGRVRSRTPADAIYDEHLPPGSEYVWLGDTTWLVLFREGRATELLNMKGL